MLVRPVASSPVDVFVIGGGINGCGIARDLAGRGLSVVLAEMGDLAQATSSSSTKLFHGGLRYLEYFEFGLVAKALAERETLLKAMPHIAWPMRFVLPYHRDMRFEGDTPTSRLMSLFMPWMKGRRPAWLIRLGLFLYDHLGGRKILPGTTTVDLSTDEVGTPLNSKFERAYEYSDVWVEDSRLVVLNARDAKAQGASILVGTKVISATRVDGLWLLTLQGPNGFSSVSAKAVVNAAGPWVENVLRQVTQIRSNESVRLVRGSHIVTRKLFDHDKCYFFQGTDGRIIFAIPYEQDFTLIGTTDHDFEGAPLDAKCTEAEQDYLCNFASQYFAKPVTQDDIVWSYSGVRPLYNDGVSSATAATRDYVLSLDSNGAPLLSVFGGKITTYRKLAEEAAAKLLPFFANATGNWTAGAPLPGGDFAVDGVADLRAKLCRDYPFLTDSHCARLIRAYGTDAWMVLGNTKTNVDLGKDFGATLTEAEVLWLIDQEFARSAADIVWRRSKLGLKMSDLEIAKLEYFVGNHLASTSAIAPTAIKAGKPS